MIPLCRRGCSKEKNSTGETRCCSDWEALPKRTALCAARTFNMLVAVAAQPDVIAANCILTNTNKKEENGSGGGGTVYATIGSFIFVLHCAAVPTTILIKAGEYIGLYIVVWEKIRTDIQRIQCRKNTAANRLTGINVTNVQQIGNSKE